MLDRLPEQRIIDLAGKDVGVQFELADLLSSEIHYIQVCHKSSLFLPANDAAGPDF